MTITAEQAKALLASITPGPWKFMLLDTDLHLEKKARRSIFRGGYFGYAVMDDVHGRKSRPVIALLPMCDADHRDDARAIAALPDALATVVAQAARIEALEAEKAELRILLARNLVMDFGCARDAAAALGGGMRSAKDKPGP